jgi:hypothetical protein
MLVCGVCGADADAAGKGVARDPMASAAAAAAVAVGAISNVVRCSPNVSYTVYPTQS